MSKRRLTGRQQREIARLNEMNDAEQICYAQAHMGKAFKNLKPESFNRVRPVLEVSTERLPIEASGGGFTVGDSVAMTPRARVNAALCGDKSEGRVDGVLDGGRLLRVNNVIYAAKLWRKA